MLRIHKIMCPNCMHTKLLCNAVFVYIIFCITPCITPCHEWTPWAILSRSGHQWRWYELDWLTCSLGSSPDMAFVVSVRDCIYCLLPKDFWVIWVDLKISSGQGFASRDLIVIQSVSGVWMWNWIDWILLATLQLEAGPSSSGCQSFHIRWLKY